MNKSVKLLSGVALILSLGGYASAVDFAELQTVRASGGKAFGEESVPSVNMGYVASNDPSAATQTVKFVTIPGGKFTMGTDTTEKYLKEYFEDARPIHGVDIKTFEMSKTAVTVAQYAECVIKGQCTEPSTGKLCNWGVKGRQLHPVNCVDWFQAEQYAKFAGARLPSEAEWEYAATSGGRNQKYPWGNDEPTCDNAVIRDNEGYDCGNYSTKPVCSKPKGDTAHGLCDMAGNVWQWVQDKYQDSYIGAPVDGSAFEGAGSLRVLRGGSFLTNFVGYLRADNRVKLVSTGRNELAGFRLAKSR